MPESIGTVSKPLSIPMMISLESIEAGQDFLPISSEVRYAKK